MMLWTQKWSLVGLGVGALEADAGPLLGLAPERPRALRVARGARELARQAVDAVAARHALRLAAQRAVQRALRALRRRLHGERTENAQCATTLIWAQYDYSSTRRD